MCTLTIAWRVFEEAPVVVAANRDEALDRPAEPPSRFAEDPAVIAPRDADAGGTWVGVNEHGLFVGITNRWIDATLAGERSRGLLVRDALATTDAETAARLVENAVAEHEYDGFNLVLADETAAFLLEWDGHLYVRQFEPGVHVVVNVGADDSFVIPSRRSAVAEEQADNAAAVRAALQPEPGESARAWRERAAGVLRDHDYGVCVHGDGFGTRSSSLVSVFREEAAVDGGRDGDASGPLHVDYAFAEGPPCETAYEPVDATF